MGLNHNNWLAISLTFVLAGLFLVLISGGAEAGYAHSVSVPEDSQQEGKPDETLTYIIEVENTGSENDEYSLGLSTSIPTGWAMYILPSTISLSDGNKGTVTLYVEIGDRSNATGGYSKQISIWCQSDGDSSNNESAGAVSKVLKIYGTTLSSSTTLVNVDPNNAATFSITVTNDKGNFADEVTFSQDSTGTDDWTFTLPGKANLAVDASTTVSFSVTPDIEALAGLKSISFVGTSLAEKDGNKPVSTITITVKVNQLPALQTDKVGSSSSDVEAGKRVYYSFEVTNKGNAVDTFNMAVDTSSLPEGWDASLDQDKISNLGVDESINLTDVLVVKAPTDAVAESETSIIVTISSDYNSSINSTYTSRTTVLQNYEPKLSIVGEDTMSAKPEQQVNFTIRIANDGNGEDDISLSLVGSNSSWGQLGDSAFTLVADTNETTTLRVTPPKGTEAQNGYILVVRATSEDGITINSRNIFINVQQIYEVSVQVSGDSSKKGDPGDELNYQMTVKNKGNGEDTISLVLEGDNADWGSILDEVELASGETTTVNLSVNIDDDATVGDYDIVVRGTSEDNPSANDTGTVKVTVNKQFKVDVVVSSKNGDPGTTISYDIVIQNEGTGTDTFSVTVDDYPAGWSVEPVAFQVEDVIAGGEETVKLNVTIPSGEDNNQFTFNLTASSDEARKENPPKYVNTTVSIITIVNQEYWIEFGGYDTQLDATVGIPIAVDFNVINKGSGDDVVALSVDPPEGWSSVTFNTNYVSVSEGEQAEATLTITVPEGTEDRGYPYDVVVTGISDCATCANGTKSVATATFAVDVQLNRGVEMTAVVTSTTKIPGENASYTFSVKNIGDGTDNFTIDILDDDLSWASLSQNQITLTKEGTALITVTVSLPVYDIDTLTSVQRNALQASDYMIRVMATSDSKSSATDEVTFNTNIGDTYGVKLEIVGSERIISYPSTEVVEDERTEKFTFKLTNTGNGQDTISTDIIATSYPDEWEVAIYQMSTCSSSFTGSIGAGQSKYLYLCVTPDQDSDVGNYTILTEFAPNSGMEPAENVTVTLEVASPRRALTATAIDVAQEIYPVYGGTSSQNIVKFKVKLDNTGSNIDIFIPEVETTFTGRISDWEVTFCQRGTTVPCSSGELWPSSGVSIEDGELDDLWVFVQVSDDADEGNETIEISVRDEEDDPKARADVELTVIIQRPELAIETSDISLEIDGVIGNSSLIKDGDTVVVYVDVENTGEADADDVRVEVFYYPKKSPTTQSEIDDLMIAGFILDPAKNTYIYVLYDKETNIKATNKKSIASGDWVIEGGEWYVEARADYDDDDSNGEILEPNENNNDARYAELLRVKPDLSIDSMRVDSKYAGVNAQTPNIGDTVTFTATITNSGAADVNDARLYITADSSADNEILVERSNKEYIKFDVDAGETTDVRFRWKAMEDEWSSFRAEVNPVCDDYDISSSECESEGDGFALETDRMFDELGRYTNNEYPTTGVFEQNDVEIKFEILPDFKIKKVAMDPRDPEVGESVEVTVTIENIGNADWQVGLKPLTIVFEDGTGTETTVVVGESINKDDSVEVKFTWIVPDEDKATLALTYTIDAGSGDFEIQQCDICDDTNSGDGKDNDEYQEDLAVVLPAVLGEIEAITYLTERDLVRGVPLIIPVIGLIGLLALAIPLVMYRRRSGGKTDEDEEEESEEDEEEPTVAPPSKIGVAIVSTVDGKTANVKVPANMPVNKLLQNCVGKFPLPHANFAVTLNGVAVDLNLSLEDAGLTDGCQVDLVPLE